MLASVQMDGIMTNVETHSVLKLRQQREPTHKSFNISGTYFNA
jgi:hypothetical protein